MAEAVLPVAGRSVSEGPRGVESAADVAGHLPGHIPFKGMRAGIRCERRAAARLDRHQGNWTPLL